MTSNYQPPKYRKLLALVLFSAIFQSNAFAQEKLYDSVAIKLLDKMTGFIGDLTSCSFKTHTILDETDDDYGLLTHDKYSTVTFQGANKMQVMTEGEKGKSGYWYNGEQMVYYSFTNNYFGSMQTVPGNTIETINKVHDDYGVDFPAADLFYPTFTDDLIEDADRIEYLGKVMMNNKNYYKIAAKGNGMTYQLWITDDAYFLPARFVIRNEKNATRYYEVNLSDWHFNTAIPDSFFEFDRPPHAAPLIILPKNPKKETVQ
jgi:hypothetical protein